MLAPVGFVSVFTRMLSTHSASLSVRRVIARWAIALRLARSRTGRLTAATTLCVAVVAIGAVAAALASTSEPPLRSFSSAPEMTLLLSPFVAVPTLHHLLAR
jgi:hypothetical protein